MNTTTTVPTTREEAINALVEQDAAKWGEAEREASRQVHGGKSLAMALTELAARATLAGDRAAAKALNAAIKAAKATMTRGERSTIRNAG